MGRTPGGKTMTQKQHAGRPRSNIDKKTLSLYLPVDTIIKIEEYCDRNGRNKSDITNELFETFFEYENQEKLALQYKLKEIKKERETLDTKIKLIQEKLGEIEHEESKEISKQAQKELEKQIRIENTIKGAAYPEYYLGKEIEGIKITKEMITAIHGT